MTQEELQELANKELVLCGIVAWLKGKGLWEECKDSLGLEGMK